MNRRRRVLLERNGHNQWLQLKEMEEINSKLGAILLLLTKVVAKNGS